MSQGEDTTGVYEKCIFTEEMELEKQKQKKTPKGELFLRAVSPERVIALLCVLLAVTFVFFMALTIVNLQRVSAVWEALEQAQMHSEVSHVTAWHNLSEVQLTRDKQLSRELNVVQGLLLRVSQEVENVWWNVTQCKAECGKELSDRLRILAAEKDELELVLQQLGEVKQEQSRVSTLLNVVLEETRNFSDHFHPELLCTRCPIGWQQFGMSCYFFSTTRKSWQGAKDSCAELSAHLVIVDNKQENIFLASFIMDFQVFWLGLSDSDSEGYWLWVNGLSGSFSSWNTGEPSNSGYEGENCAVVYSSGFWNDINCFNNEFWICERSII